MKLTRQFGKWLLCAGISLALVLPSLGQNRHNDRQSAPRPNRQEQRQSRPEPPRPNRQEQRQSRPELQRPQNRPQSQPQPRYEAPRPSYQPPSQGHHSGQWLNQHREQPLDQQKRDLQSDPQFRKLP